MVKKRASSKKTSTKGQVKRPLTSTATEEKASANGASDKGRLQELVDLVANTAEAKGWEAVIAARDEKRFKYATVAVSWRAPHTFNEITGVFEITCDERIDRSPKPRPLHGADLSTSSDFGCR